MGLDEQLRGFCYNDLEIKQLIEEGRIQGHNICTESNLITGEKTQIQPCSFDPRITGEVIVLSTHGTKIKRPEADKTYHRVLLENVSSFRRRSHDSTNGYELKKGFTYILPLEEKVTLQEGEVMKSSPKSSLGRLFVNSRLITDYSDVLDKIKVTNKELRMYLLVQPLTFNMIVYPGLRLNQLRFIKGDDAKLRDSELKQIHAQTPLAYEWDNGEYVPAKGTIGGGLEVRLDLLGRNTSGIVGFRAIDNPDPIDLSQTFSKDKKEHELIHLPHIEDYFEPIEAGPYTMQSGDHCLFATLEQLHIPGNLSGELKANSSLGISGPCHFAGFFDPGWLGDIVLEWRSDELTGMELTHGMPVSTTDIYRNNNPEVEYGEGIGSNYRGQVGVRVSKYFMLPDFKEIAKEYNKLDREVLVQEALILQSLRKRDCKKQQVYGFQYITQDEGLKIYQAFNEGFFKSRYECERDPSVLQAIPYIIFFGNNETVYKYRRAMNIQDAGEKRLWGKRSIGIGGHVNKTDGPNYISHATQREIDEEVKITGQYSPPQLIGTLLCNDTPVDRVHFGLVYASLVDGIVEHNESSIIEGEMDKIKDVQNLPLITANFETWSLALVPELGNIYERLTR